jgi:hypothetical protein
MVNAKPGDRPRMHERGPGPGGPRFFGP